MRIRKHSILSSPPFRPTSLSSNSPTIDVCEFNRSPWDTIPLNTLESDYPFQVNEKEEHPELRKEEPVNSKRNIVYEEEEYDEFGEEERRHCVKKRGWKESEEVKRDPEYIQCSKTNEKEEYPSDSVGKEPVNSKRYTVYEEEEYDEFGEEERFKRRPCVKKRRRKKSEEVKREPGYIQCSKTNGGGWQCKEEAKQGKRLCERHRMQKEFCEHKYDRSSWKSTEDKPSKTVMAGKKKSKRASEFHYYTKFGPSYTLGRKIAGRNETTMNNNEIVDKVIDQAKPSKTVMAGKKRRNTERVSSAARSDQYYYYTGFGPSYSSGRRRTGRHEVIDQARTTSSASEVCNGVYFVDYFEDYEDENDDDEEEKGGKESNHKPIKATSPKSVL